MPLMPAFSQTPILDILALVSSLFVLLAFRDHRKRRGLPYPPGPRPLPLIGNLLDVPKEFSWLSYIQLSKKYGDVLSFRVFGRTVVILNSFKATKDLFENRADVYADRPEIPIIDMMKWGWMLGFSRYNESCRQERKLINRNLRPAAVATYRPLLQRKAHAVLSQLLANPGDFKDHLYHLTGSQILEMGYGYEVKEPNDRNLDAARQVMRIISDIACPGSYIVNLLPCLRYIPGWIPWLSYKPIARYGYEVSQQALYGPMGFVREAVLNGTAQPSQALENLQEVEKLEGPERGKAEELIARVIASAFIPATETTAAALMWFIVAALVRPEIQTRAQKELDAATKRERLPTFEDLPELPFIDAICKEVLRWRPIGPLSLPHATTEDDVYNGFFIPKGATVMMNVWAILHDPVVYPEPDIFKPERYLGPDGSPREDPRLKSVFGSGKRICPGRHLAESTLFIVIASLLSAFNIAKDDGTDRGRPDSKADMYPSTGGGIIVPCPFTCSILPRDRKAEELIVVNTKAQ